MNTTEPINRLAELDQAYVGVTVEALELFIAFNHGLAKVAMTRGDYSTGREYMGKAMRAEDALAQLNRKGLKS